MMASFLGKLGLIGWLSQTVGNGIDHMGMSWVGGTILLTLIYLYSHSFLRQHHRTRDGDVRRLLRRRHRAGAPPALLGLILAFSSSLMMSLTITAPAPRRSSLAPAM